MSNMEMVIELLKSVPMSSRLENYQRLRRLTGLSIEDMRLAFWKAEYRTDEEIEKLKQELKDEAEHEALMNFLANLTTTNPAGNLPFGNPESNLSKLISITNLTKTKVDLSTAFKEVFGESKYQEVIEGSSGDI